MTYLSLGSIVLGLVAMGLPLADMRRISRSEAADESKTKLAIFLSLSACIVAVLLQFVYQDHLLRIGDMAALMDTMNATFMISTILTTITIVLNLILLKLSKDAVIETKEPI